MKKLNLLLALLILCQTWAFAQNEYWSMPPNFYEPNPD